MVRSISVGMWMATVLPVFAICEFLHLWLRTHGEKKKSIWPKCLVTWMMVCTAAIGLYQHQNQQEEYLILIAMMLFMIADACLVEHFFVGMGVFAAGHLSLITWFLKKGEFTAASIPVWIVTMVLVLVLFRQELRDAKEHPAIYLMLLYPCVLLGMVAIAVVMPFTKGDAYWWAAIGATIFAASDMMVGKSFFKKLSFGMEAFALGLYYVGIFCLSMMTWMI